MPFVRPLVVALGLVRELRNFDSLRCGFYREPIRSPATGIAGHLTEIIDYELGGESRIALPDRPKRLVRNVTGKCLRSSTPAIRTLIIGQGLLRSWELGDASRNESTLG